MQIKLSTKELLILLDVIIFSHKKFHRAEFSALIGTNEQSRKELREQVLEALIECFSDNDIDVDMNFNENNLRNIKGYFDHFMQYEDYEREARFKRDDLMALFKKLIG